MIEVKKEDISLHKNTLSFKNESVLYPAGIIKDGSNQVIYRAAGEANYLGIGYCKLKDFLTVEERFVLPILSQHLHYRAPRHGRHTHYQD